MDDFNWSDCSILIVEDNYLGYKLLQALLKNSLVNILYADNGIKAIEMVKNHPEINLILMDIQLPLMDGYETTSEIKKIRPDIPVIAQTANAMDDDKAKCLNAGCIDYIAKPIVFETLFRMINNYIRKTN